MKKSNLLHSEQQLNDWAKDNGFTNLEKPDFYPAVAIAGRVIEKNGEVVDKSYFVYAEDFGKPAHEATLKVFKVKANTVHAHNKDKDAVRAFDAKEKEENV